MFVWNHAEIQFERAVSDSEDWDNFSHIYVILICSLILHQVRCKSVTDMSSTRQSNVHHVSRIATLLRALAAEPIRVKNYVLALLQQPWTEEFGYGDTATSNHSISHNSVLRSPLRTQSKTQWVIKEIHLF